MFCSEFVVSFFVCLDVVCFFLDCHVFIVYNFLLLNGGFCMFERREFRVGWLRAWWVWCREVDRVSRWREVVVIKRRLECELVERAFVRMNRVGWTAMLGCDDYDRCVELGVSLNVAGAPVVVREAAGLEPLYGHVGSRAVGVTGMQGVTGAGGLWDNRNNDVWYEPTLRGTGFGDIVEPVAIGDVSYADYFGGRPVEVQVSFDVVKNKQLVEQGPKVNRRMGWVVNERIEQQPKPEQPVMGQHIEQPGCVHTKPVVVAHPLVSDPAARVRARWAELLRLADATHNENERTGDDTREQGA